jgi:hypothetical protein
VPQLPRHIAAPRARQSRFSFLAGSPRLAAVPKSQTPCVFCGATGSLSRQHVISRRIRKALRIRERVQELSGTTYVGSAETLAIVFHEVCEGCNKGWLESLESAAWPVLEPLLLGAVPGTAVVLDPADQAVLATWAVETALVLALSKFRDTDHGWVPVDTLQWLYHHRDLRMPPPGCRVWLAGLDTSNIPASVQAACLYGDDREPMAQVVLFSVGCALFQVFAPRQQDADLPADTETWLAPVGVFQLALLQIAPAGSATRWPPPAVCSAADRELVARRLTAGLAAKT